MIGLPGPELDEPSARLLNEIKPGGICLFARNIRSSTQVRELTDAIRDVSVVPPMIAIDQEGGTVDRLKRIITPLAAAASIQHIDEASDMGRLVGRVLRLLGINLDFAPVVDVVSGERSGSSNGLFTRPFPGDAASVKALAFAFYQGLRSQGVAGCLKHFPGLGAARVDSHEELPLIDIDEAELRAVDLLPYSAWFEEEMPTAVMIAHAAYNGTSLQEIGQNGKLLPSSLSRRFVDGLLRSELGFEGVSITDDLEMGAVVLNFGIDEASILAIEAGNDLLAICAGENNIRAAHSAVMDAVSSGRIEPERLDRSLERLRALHGSVEPPATFDIAEIGVISEETARFNARLKT